MFKIKMRNKVAKVSQVAFENNIMAKYRLTLRSDSPIINHFVLKFFLAADVQKHVKWQAAALSICIEDVLVKCSIHTDS